MKFLVDACAGRRLADWLSAGGHDVVFAPKFGKDPGDPVLLTWAVREQRILISIDNDFGSLIFRDQVDHAGVIRLPDVPASRRIELVRQILERHAAELEACALVTVRDNRIRVRL